MSINGKHTIAEIRDLARTVEFRIKATQALIAKVNTKPTAFVTTPGVPPDVILRYNAWQNRWRNTSNEVLPLVTALSWANPLIPADALGAEDQYKKLKFAINKSGDDTHADPGDMFNVIQAVEDAAKERIDETNAPQPQAGDPDFAAYLALDKSIKAGEAAAKAAKDAANAAAKSNTGIAIGVGLGIAGGLWLWSKVGK